MMEFLAAHSDAVIALVSAVVGAVLGCFGSYWLWWMERRRQRYVAKMQILINLRHWMKLTQSQMLDIQTWVGSDGAGGNLYSCLPDFRFEQSLEQVALLEHQMAMKIFKLIHKKDGANTEIEAEHEYGDDDYAVDILRARTARLWLRALGIYDLISKEIGWSERAFSDKDKEMMQVEIDRFQELEQDRAKSNAELFSDM